MYPMVTTLRRLHGDGLYRILLFRALHAGALIDCMPAFRPMVWFPIGTGRGFYGHWWRLSAEIYGMGGLDGVCYKAQMDVWVRQREGGKIV